MRVFKSSYRDGEGRTRPTARWYVEIRDQRETVRRLSAFTSKAASEELGRNLDKLVAYYKSSGGQIDPKLSRWLTELPRRTRDRLVMIGLVDADRVSAHKPLADHLIDFEQSLRAKDCTERHVSLVTGRARRIIDGCKFRFYADISASRVMDYLHGLRADTEDKRGISAQTFNFYVQAIKQLCRWMVKDRRALESPVAHLDGLNVKTDRRHDRRALTVDELRGLLNAAENGPERYGMTGAERTLLYRLAVETGLRAGELRSLTRASFDLDADPPTVTVAAAYSKRRRDDLLILRPELADDLRAYLCSKAPATVAFKLPKPNMIIRMFKADLEAAGIPYRDDVGRVADFHALRHTFITNLASGGVHPKTAQSLARHSDITLTMNRYSHSYRDQEIDALRTLPDLSNPSRQRLRATGTDDAVAGDSHSADYLAQKERRGASGGGAGGREVPVNANDKMHEKPRQTGGECRSDGAIGEGGIRTRDTGLTPYDGLANRCLQPLGHLSKSFIYS